MSTYVIVGGVAGGATAAARLRRRDESAEIIIIERGAYVSFANCGLPYHVGEVITQREALLVSTPEKLHEELAIDVRTLQEVVHIDRQAKEVSVRDLKSGETYRLAYDKLVLSPGAKPFVPPISGVDIEGVHTLRNIPDMDAIKARVDSGEVRTAIVVGGGFIGLEMAENLVERDVEVVIVEMLPQVMSTIDFEMAALLHRELREAGVRLALGDGLKEIQATEQGRLRATLSSGRTAEADMVIMAIGVRPESDLARSAGLELGPKGHIVVNAQMQTNDADIYAVGDAIQVLNPITNQPTAIPLAGPANRQARIAADHITGLTSAYQGTIGTAIAKVFGLAAATTGLNSHALEQAGIPFLSSNTHSDDHVGYYPGAQPLTIKLLYTPEEGRLLGAQVVGYKAVDRTIDILATALKTGMTVFDLEHLELAYAPPYGAAKDPVNIAGYVAANWLRGDTDLASWREIRDLDPEHSGILDVRTEPEWTLGHIPGALHIPNTELRERLGELSKDKEWIVYCAVGRRAYAMERMLKQHGYQARNLSGGWQTYSVATEQQSNFDECLPCRVEIGRAEPVLAHAVPAHGATVQTSEVVAEAEAIAARIDAELDACGLQCPGPIMAVYKRMQDMQGGEVLEVLASDPGFARDISAWCERTGNALVDLSRTNGTIRAVLRKSDIAPTIRAAADGALPNGKTIVVFSADLDRALASFVIANGAAAMGQPVTMFFTFWGLNILRRTRPPAQNKTPIERMFGWMLPKGADALKLSKLNMGGMGTWMMKQVMKSKRIESLPELMRGAQENGVKLIACQMSMDMMGIKAEELIDGVDIGGVATFISETDKGNASLFI